MNVDFNERENTCDVLNQYCLNEIENNLQDIEANLNIEQKKQIDNKIFIKVLHDLQFIEDLAIVYGYEGIETLVEHLSNTISRELENKNITEKLFSKLVVVIDAVRNMSNIEDTEKIETIVFNTINEIDCKLKEPKLIETKTSDPNVSSEEQAEITVVEEEDELIPTFDINESKSIVNLIHKIESENSNYFDDIQSLENQENMHDVPDTNIRELYNDIFMEESMESLDYLKKYVDLAKKGESLGEAVMHIKDACNSLKDSANCYHVVTIQKPLALIDSIVKEKLNYSEPPPLILLEVLSDTEKTIRNYIENNEDNFKTLIEKLNYIYNEE